MFCLMMITVTATILSHNHIFDGSRSTSDATCTSGAPIATVHVVHVSTSKAIIAATTTTPMPVSANLLVILSVTFAFHIFHSSCKIITTAVVIVVIVSSSCIGYKDPTQINFFALIDGSRKDLAHTPGGTSTKATLIMAIVLITTCKVNPPSISFAVIFFIAAFATSTVSAVSVVSVVSLVSLLSASVSCLGTPSVIVNTAVYRMRCM